MRPRALVSQTRLPEIDRDSGSQQVDLYVRWLLEAGWSVTFLASERDGEERHARRLRQAGVATFVGLDEAEELIAAGRFDLAVLAFWAPASKILPLLRAGSPGTRVIVDSVDLHFLREARRALGAGGHLDESFGGRLANELNTYRDADAVLAPSAKEADLLANFIDPGRIHDLPPAKTPERSELGFERRRGMFFAGNFRHLPNGEAVEYLCREILPLLDPDLLEANPLSVVGSRLDEKVRAHGRGVPAARMIGWVPSIRPYLERARVTVAPLLHGAGVKGKIIESLITGTPVVTTKIGAEGLDLRSGEHAIVADGPADLAAAVTELLTDGQRWQRLANAGFEHAHARHAPARVGARFLEIVAQVLAAPVQDRGAATSLRRTGRREAAYRAMVAAVGEIVPTVTDPDSIVLVVSRGDDALTAIEGRDAWHFPQGSDARWSGHHPADGADAVRQLEALRERGAAYLAVPASSFWWLDHYRELAEHLDGTYRRIHSSEHLVIFRLARAPAEPDRDDQPPHGRVAVVGVHTGVEPPAETIAELDGSERFAVAQSWRPGGPDGGAPARLPAIADDESEWTLFVDDRASLPAGFLDEFLAAASALASAGVERVQPAHASGPDAGPPVCEQLAGVLARELEAVTPLPVLAVRKGASTTGPIAVLDALPIGLRAPIRAAGDPLAYSNVRDVFVAAGEGPTRAVRRSQRSGVPVISVLIATYARPELLRGCLEGFCDQTLPVADFEVVVVDDGSPGDETAALLADFAGRLPLTQVRVDHAGRSAAKNLAQMLARGDIVLFFDDDDVPAPKLLEEHVRAHELCPDETTAILGHTDWAPGLAVSPLMHYLTEVDKMLFSYGNLEPGERRDWRCFWEGRVSSKRSLQLRGGLHDQRLDYSIDVELAWRLARNGLEVVYEPSALSFMARPIDFDGFCRRCEAKGRAQAAIASLHGDEEIAAYLGTEGAEERWREAQPRLGELIARIAQLESALADGVGDGEARDSSLAELHGCYREAFRAYNSKGIAEALRGSAPPRPARPPASTNGHPAPVDPGPAGPSANGGPTPELTVTMPVWSRTPELAEMAASTIERVWEVARMATEVIVVDNGSPVQRPMRARVQRFESNRGVATAWNVGIGLARAPLIAVLNSDCRVEDGWDEALCEAVTTGRRIAFPYTDHCDGDGFRRPDQAGTAGWCFMLTRALFEEIGPFDERFNPAYVEDTDYWHRAWQLGIELAPVPAARVTHARRTSADDRSDWLLTGHRYLYGWKHGVEPMRAPPYYNRDIVEYQCGQGSVRSAATT